MEEYAYRVEYRMLREPSSFLISNSFCRVAWHTSCESRMMFGVFEILPGFYHIVTLLISSISETNASIDNHCMVKPPKYDMFM